MLTVSISSVTFQPAVSATSIMNTTSPSTGQRNRHAETVVSSQVRNTRTDFRGKKQLFSNSFVYLLRMMPEKLSCLTVGSVECWCRDSATDQELFRYSAVCFYILMLRSVALFGSFFSIVPRFSSGNTAQNRDDAMILLRWPMNFRLKSFVWMGSLKMENYSISTIWIAYWSGLHIATNAGYFLHQNV